jgi:predicted deacylase
MRVRTIVTGFVLGLALASCQTAPIVENAKSQLPPALSKPICENDLAVIRADHATARLNGCKVTPNGQFIFTIKPEKRMDPQGQTINNSPWYGFRVDPQKSGTTKFQLVYKNGTHRYQPKISYDGVNWRFLPNTKTPNPRPKTFDFQVKLDKRSFFISAQEIFTTKAHNNWSKKLAEKDFIQKTEIGKSKEGRPIHMLEVATDETKKKPYVVLIGRQHPPEVTGALALMPFAEETLNQDELSTAFLEKFNLLIVPLVNPDGVAAGNWRFNMGGTDLNRDWGPFKQPETRAVRDALKRFETGEDRIAFFLDFHSTWRNLLYTQTDEEPTKPPMFTKKWVEAVDNRLSDKVYKFTREPRAVSERPISKNYIYELYGVPAITYEVGDATPRKAIDESARVFAEEMMVLLLEHETSR